VTWEPIRRWATPKECDADLPRFRVPLDGGLLMDSYVPGWCSLADNIMDPRAAKGRDAWRVFAGCGSLPIGAFDVAPSPK
jgi:hypothetical protein